MGVGFDCPGRGVAGRVLGARGHGAVVGRRVWEQRIPTGGANCQDDGGPEPVHTARGLGPTLSAQSDRDVADERQQEHRRGGARSTVDDTYTIGNDGRVWDAGGWSSLGGGYFGPYLLPTNQTTNEWVHGGGIAAVARTPSMLDTYTIAGDGHIWMASGWNSGAWAAPYVMLNQSGYAWVGGGGVAAVSQRR